MSNELLPIVGASSIGGLELGASLAHVDAQPQGFIGPIFDPHSGCIFVISGVSILRVRLREGRATVDMFAGHPSQRGQEDGNGEASRFQSPNFLAVDGVGSLYVADQDCIRCCWPTNALCDDSQSLPVQVTTLPFPPPNFISGLTFAPAGPGPAGTSAPSPSSTTNSTSSPATNPTTPSGSLIFSTATALYRMTMNPRDHPSPDPSAPDPHRPPPPASPPLIPYTAALLAGREGVSGSADGPSTDARFRSLVGGLVSDAQGSVYLADSDVDLGSCALRRVSPGGEVLTLVEGLAGRLIRPAILPNGAIAFCDYAQDCLRVLGLGLQPAGLGAAWGGAGEGRGGAAAPGRTLHADMGALLDAQPDGTADLTLVVAGRRFPAHRAILIARCDYFKQRLTGDFADGAATELSLPDADPAAFELLLRFVYTGRADIPPALAPAVAELADRLLLPELCAEAQAAVLGGVTPEGVVGLMLWAEARGEAFEGLLGDLKAWYLQHQVEVLQLARDSLLRLSAASPDLMVALLAEGLGLGREGLGREGLGREGSGAGKTAARGR
ncbi:hypothetical protein HYH03_002014 [Edaphochlamys debaryana]|uniref:BTB domain-containing protein n=1 Tax=Edaphochlamys debaryana TaxID=47281 RepID=A0A835YD69_9CHLO|nr:hypothetical protein HYH03_002014 [Edaphochlamys debaryana]|eukprot:KAG2500446.1 hypothetical protein HYH03_002014 [Edaphochlamys debaryana]